MAAQYVLPNTNYTGKLVFTFNGHAIPAPPGRLTGGALLSADGQSYNLSGLADGSRTVTWSDNAGVIPDFEMVFVVALPTGAFGVATVGSTP